MSARAVAAGITSLKLVMTALVCAKSFTLQKFSRK